MPDPNNDHDLNEFDPEADTLVIITEDSDYLNQDDENYERVEPNEEDTQLGSMP